jgi:hypothetical protein
MSPEWPQAYITNPGSSFDSARRPNLCFLMMVGGEN